MVSVKRALVHLILAGTLAVAAVGYTVISQHVTDTVPQALAWESSGGSGG
ncbi:MAG: hypothetical protein ACE5H9_05490 [Anaerolineae bacterium]